MELKLYKDNVTVVIKTTFVDKEGNLRFGKRSEQDIQDLLDNIVHRAKYDGENQVTTRYVKYVYDKFKEEYLIPLVSCTVNAVTYKGEKLAVI